MNILNLIEKSGRPLWLPNLDLSGHDLTGINLGKITFDNSDFSQAVLAGANLHESSLTSTSFTGATMTKAALTSVVARFAKFTAADLTRSQLRGDFSSANFTDAVLVEATLRGNFNDAIFDGAAFDNTHLGGTFKNGSFINCRFRCQVTETGLFMRLVNCDFTGANLISWELPLLTVTGCKFDNANLENLSFPALIEAWRENKKYQLDSDFFANTSFIGANLRGVNFTGFDLSTANFQDADLRGANFTGCTFGHQTNFVGAKLARAIWNDAAGLGDVQTDDLQLLGDVTLAKRLKRLAFRS